MTDRVAVVTGASSGVGLATSHALAEAGFHLALVVRDPARGEQARRAVSAHGGAVEVVVADLSSLAEVRRAAQDILARHPEVHLLVNNAGGVFWKRWATVDGHERTFALNVLSPFLLTRLLDPALRAAGGGARVVWISSAAHYRARLDLSDLESRRSYHGFSVYSRSKLAVTLVCRAFAARSSANEVLHVAVHPGFVRTRFGQEDGGARAVGMRLVMIFAISPEQAARTVLYAATSPELAGEPGAYVSRARRAETSPEARDTATGDRLWVELSRSAGLAA